MNSAEKTAKQKEKRKGQYKMRKWCLLLILSLGLPAGCDERDDKKLYDSSINQVIRLENDRLTAEDPFEIQRKKTGIAVYADGDIILLIYTKDSTTIDSFYLKKSERICSPAGF